MGAFKGTTPRRLLFAQGTYYLVTGIWPLLDRRTFEAVTGRKRDRWLVRTVGILAIAFGGLILRSAAQPRPDPVPGLSGAAAFGTASLWYWARGRINDAYLLDGLAEATMVGAWLGLVLGGPGRPAASCLVPIPVGPPPSPAVLRPAVL